VNKRLETSAHCAPYLNASTFDRSWVYKTNRQDCYAPESDGLTVIFDVSESKEGVKVTAKIRSAIFTPDISNELFIAFKHDLQGEYKPFYTDSNGLEWV
jgi:hypothetical protein